MTPREIVLTAIRKAAQDGKRCPTNDQLRDLVWDAGFQGLPLKDTPSELAYEGILRTEVYARNWRVVVIDGMRTKEPPNVGEPYLTIP